jgi:hypothetical protein
MVRISKEESKTVSFKAKDYIDLLTKASLTKDNGQMVFHTVLENKLDRQASTRVCLEMPKNGEMEK